MPERTWICSDCGEKHGKLRGSEDSETYHNDTCDFCGEIKTVCHVRRYGYPEIVNLEVNQ